MTRIAGTTRIILFLIISLFLASPVTAQTPNPRLSDLYLQLGQSYEEATQPAKASEFYLKALETDPANTQALSALRQTLQQQSEDPRVTIADQYLATDQYDEAIKLYLAILADNRAQADIQQKAQIAVDQSGSWWRQLGEDLTSAGKAIIFGILILIGLLFLWLIARSVRKIRQSRLDKDQSRYVVLPFRNATGVQNLVGVDEGVRAAITDWLYTNHAAVHDKAVVVEPISLPDIGGAAKIATWFSSQITPAPNATFIDGTLLGARSMSSKSEVGLMVCVRKESEGLIDRMRTFWGAASSASDPDAYIQLAYSAATWVYQPENTMQPSSAELLLQSHAHFAQARLQSDQTKKKLEVGVAIDLGKAADVQEQKKVTTGSAAGQAGGGTIRELGAGGSQKTSVNVIPSSLPAERVAMYEAYLRELA